eukprot:scaffold614_cov367-Prasinococcus_capsulatus_cf.AAC.36
MPLLSTQVTGQPEQVRKTMEMAIARLSLHPPRADRPAPSARHAAAAAVYEVPAPLTAAAAAAAAAAHAQQHYGAYSSSPLGLGHHHAAGAAAHALQQALPLAQPPPHHARTYANNALQPGPGEIAAHVHVPGERVGSIIGKGGANIDRIRQLSGTRVRVHNDEVGPGGLKLVEVVGTPEQTEAAKQLIASFVNSNHIPPRG